MFKSEFLPGEQVRAVTAADAAKGGQGGGSCPPATHPTSVDQHKDLPLPHHHSLDVSRGECSRSCPFPSAPFKVIAV